MAKLKSVAVPAVPVVATMTFADLVAQAAAKGVQITGIPTASAPAAAELPARVWAEAAPKRNASDAGYPMAGFGTATRHDMPFTISIPQDAAAYIWALGKAGKPLTFPRNAEDKGKR